MGPTTHDRVLLIGMMGAGKTTVGRALSNVLGWPYYDNDELAGPGRRQGHPPGAGGGRHRCAAPRRVGRADVALTEGAPLIAGVAGGVVTDPLDLRRLHEGGFVVWLRADIATLAKRVDRHRPALADGVSPEKAMRALYAGREALYTAACSFVVDEDDTTPELIALEIARRLRSEFRHGGEVGAAGDPAQRGEDRPAEEQDQYGVADRPRDVEAERRGQVEPDPVRDVRRDRTAGHERDLRRAGSARTARTTG